MHPKANPQTWANMDRLKKICEGASVEEFRKKQTGALPPLEKRHREQAAAYNRWHPSGEPKAEQSKKTDLSETPQQACPSIP